MVLLELPYAIGDRRLREVPSQCEPGLSVSILIVLFSSDTDTALIYLTGHVSSTYILQFIRPLGVIAYPLPLDWMNELQHLSMDAHGPVLVTLNPPFDPKPALTFGHYKYEHPIFSDEVRHLDRSLESQAH